MPRNRRLSNTAGHRLTACHFAILNMLNAAGSYLAVPAVSIPCAFAGDCGGALACAGGASFAGSGPFDLAGSVTIANLVVINPLARTTSRRPTLRSVHPLCTSPIFSRSGVPLALSRNTPSPPFSPATVPTRTIAVVPFPRASRPPLRLADAAHWLPPAPARGGSA